MKNNHILLLIFAFIVTLFLSTIYGYMYYRINVSAQKIVKAQSIIQSADLTKQREKSFLETYKSTSQKWLSLQNMFVKSGEVVDFIEVIESLGVQSKSSVTISSIEADNLDNSPPGKEGKIKMKVSSKGSWESVMRALVLAEVLPYKININNVRLISSNNSLTRDVKIKNTWELSFDLQAAMIAATSSSLITK